MSKWVDEDELTITYRTLKQGMAEAQEAERERIIALLEGLKGDCPLECDDCEKHAASVWTAIALIKGDAK